MRTALQRFEVNRVALQDGLLADPFIDDLTKHGHLVKKMIYINAVLAKIELQLSGRDAAVTLVERALNPN